MQYWMLRIFLTSRERPPLIEAIIEATSPPRATREYYLAETFGHDIRFQYRSKDYHYRPFVNESGIIAAVIGKVHTATLGSGPEDDFQPVELPDWPTANLFIDLTGTSETQTILAQRAGPIRNPLLVIRALTDHINNRNPDTDWVIATNAISDKRDFWAAVKEYEGTITGLDLTFVPPNIWGSKEETEKALKALHTATNNDQVEVRLRNDEGKLHPKGDTIEQSVDYISKGGGRAVLRARKRKVFDSQSRVVTESPEQDVKVQTTAKEKLIGFFKSLRS